MSKTVKTAHPIARELSERWSPYAYADKPVSDADLNSLFEAARWAASSYNEQPWSYIVARKADGAEFERLLGCLVEGNQPWAKNAPVLALGVIALNFSKTGKPNNCAQHDLGAASASLTFEATVRGLNVHQMSGILPDKARTEFGIPEGFAALTGIAIGYAGPRAELPKGYADRDTMPRERKSTTSFVYTGGWAKQAPFIKG